YYRPASILALLVFLLVLVLVVIAALAPVLPAVGKARVAEAGADGQHAPALDVLHERHLGQALRHAVIVHQNRGVVIANRWDRLDQACRQVELAALPVARQVLGALLDRSILVDHAGTGDPDEGCEFQAFGIGRGDQTLQHFHQPFHGALPRGLVVGMSPKLRLPDRRLRQIRRLFPAGLDHAAADIGAPDIDAK